MWPYLLVHTPAAVFKLSEQKTFIKLLLMVKLAAKSASVQSLTIGHNASSVRTLCTSKGDQQQISIFDAIGYKVQVRSSIIPVSV